MIIEDVTIKMNEFGRKNLPFFFIINFDATEGFICKLNECKEENIIFNIEGITNSLDRTISIIPKIIKYPENIEQYKKKFSKVIKELKYGNTYLINLTCKTKIEIDTDLKSLYYATYGKFKLYFKNQFVCFSPECFIRTNDNYIYTYPMKGTMINSNEFSLETILKDTKELAEHNTIVDLLRNDLSIISEDVEVTKFRFPSFVKTKDKEIIQLSSEIRGKLNSNWKNNIGDLLIKMLPAGSVTGAPKKETLRIIKEVENYNRGYYTGIFGIFDGKELNSAVIIRYIENENGIYYYKSGGGITINSSLENEYQEMIDKIYVPIH